MAYVAQTKVGTIWRYGHSGMPQLVTLLPTQEADPKTPVAGDLCQYDVSFRPEYKPSSANDDAGEDLVIRFICVDGRQELDIMNRPGYEAGDDTTPSIAYFGGRGSRETAADRAISGKRSHFIVVDEHLQWVMDRDETGDAPTPGMLVGFKRSAAGIYTIDVDVTADVIEVIAPYEPDIEAGTTRVSHPRFWVKAVVPGGNI